MKTTVLENGLVLVDLPGKQAEAIFEVLTKII